MTATLKLDAFLPYRLSVASNRVSGTIAGAYQARFGLRIPEWRLLTVLAVIGLVLAMLGYWNATRDPIVRQASLAVSGWPQGEGFAG